MHLAKTLLVQFSMCFPVQLVNLEHSYSRYIEQSFAYRSSLNSSHVDQVQQNKVVLSHTESKNKNKKNSCAPIKLVIKWGKHPLINRDLPLPNDHMCALRM